MKSRIILPGRLIRPIRSVLRVMAEDRVTVYAAQASFFVVISAVPFLTLLVSLTGLLLPEKLPAFFLNLPEELTELPERCLAEIRASSGVPLLSLSAVTTLWSASRGMAAVRVGIETVYQAKPRGNYLINRLAALIETLLCLVMIATGASLLLFGETVVSLASGWLSLPILRFRKPLLAAVMTVLFAVLYASVARRSHSVRRSFVSHLPGALFSAVGWMAFSAGYAFYLDHFSRASVLYGSLAAVCLMMLWIYFCLTILLCGAEINKFLAREKPVK